MIKRELIQEVKKILNTNEENAAKALNAVIEAIQNGLLKDGVVDIFGFGKFEIRVIKERDGYNPITKQRVILPELHKPYFKAGTALKRLFNKNVSD